MEKKPKYFVELIGRILVAANDKDFKKLADLQGDRRVKDLDLYKIDFEILADKLKDLSPSKKGDCPSQLKLSAFALDSVLMELYYDGVLIALMGKQHLEYLALTDLVSPPKISSPDSILPGVGVSGNLDFFRKADKHIKECHFCFNAVDADEQLWRKKIQDQLSSNLL